MRATQAVLCPTPMIDSYVHRSLWAIHTFMNQTKVFSISHQVSSWFGHGGWGGFRQGWRLVPPVQLQRRAGFTLGASCVCDASSTEHDGLQIATPTDKHDMRPLLTGELDAEFSDADVKFKLGPNGRRHKTSQSIPDVNPHDVKKFNDDASPVGKPSQQ